MLICNLCIWDRETYARNVRVALAIRPIDLRNFFMTIILLSKLLPLNERGIE